MRVSFRINGKIVPKGRPRFTRTGHAYTPQSTRDYEQLIKATYLSEIGNKKLNGALKVSIVANLGIPTHISKKAREELLNAQNRPTKKPDADNIAKTICDALNEVAYDDDKQIAWLSVYKQYSENESIYVTIEEI